VGLGKKLHQIYLIDYAYASLFYDQLNNQFRADNLSTTESFIGSLVFSSLNVLKGHRHARRDDLESLGIILIYFLKGELPWSKPESDLTPKQRRR
jgi:serine/threonine protein kinase